ncbi:hypothetical protein CTI14_65395, partial [Methylobacterium radiotolerans]
MFSANFSFQGVEGLMPWDFGDETLSHAKTWMQWRYRLVPYVLGAIELYLRWLTAGVFSANFSFQGVEGLMPWDFGDETLSHAKTW